MLLSRVADALYWIARYLERAEHTTRLISVRLDLGLDRQPGTDDWTFAHVYATLGMRRADDDPTNPTELIEDAIFDAANPASVMASVTAARENARQVREELTPDMWEQVNGLFLRLKEAHGEGRWSARPHYFSRLVLDGVHLFQGVTEASLAQGEGWQYLQVGRFLERAGSTAALLDRHLVSAAGSAGDSGSAAVLGGPPGHADHVRWVGLLRSCGALEAYCRHYTAELRPRRIAEFLLLNPEFPRSVRFAASRIESAFRAIAQHTGRGTGGRAVRLAGKFHASLDFGQVDEILSEDPHAYISGIEQQCAQIHAALYQSFITYPIESALPA
jgi:uncharacterized alpha-E superfamily protein